MENSKFGSGVLFSSNSGLKSGNIIIFGKPLEIKTDEREKEEKAEIEKIRRELKKMVRMNKKRAKL